MCRLIGLKLILTALMFLIHTGTTPSRAQELLSIPLEVKENEKFKIRINKERKDTKDRNVTSHIMAHYTYAGAILQADELGMTIEWKLEDANVKIKAGRLDEFKGDPNALMQFMKEPIVFDADIFGNPKRFHNYAKMADIIKVAIGDDPQYKSALEYLNKTILSLDDETAARVFLSEAALIGMGQSIETPIGQSVESTQQVPNPLGGPPIDLITILSVKRNDDQNAQFAMTSSFVPDSAAKSIMTVIEGISKSKNIPVEQVRKSMSGFSLDRKDEAEFTVSKATGWTTRVDQTRLIRVRTNQDEKTREEIWTITVEKTTD